MSYCPRSVPVVKNPFHLCAPCFLSNRVLTGLFYVEDWSAYFFSRFNFACSIQFSEKFSTSFRTPTFLPSRISFRNSKVSALNEYLLQSNFCYQCRYPKLVKKPCKKSCWTLITAVFLLCVFFKLQIRFCRRKHLQIISTKVVTSMPFQIFFVQVNWKVLQL